MRRVVTTLAIVAVGALVSACQGAISEATNVTRTSAQLNAHGATNNGPAYSYFQYAKTATPSVITTTPLRSWPGGIADTPFHETVSGLAANTSYSFRVCGNDQGRSAICQGPRSFKTTPNGRIYYDGSSDLDHVNADGSSPAPVPNTNGQGFTDPEASPSGLKLAFIQELGSSERIGTIGTDGSGLTFLTALNRDRHPVWAPDGLKLAFTRVLPGDGHYEDILVMNASGGTPTVVAHEVFDPTWSPDGTKIAFSTNDLGVVNANGTGLVTYNLSDTVAFEHPAWSPDGTRIAGTCEASATQAQPDPPEEVCATTPTGGKLQILTQSPDGALMFGGVAWSPDSTKILFSRSPSSVNQRAELRTVQSDGSNFQTLTNTVLNEYEPTWAPVP